MTQTMAEWLWTALALLGGFVSTTLFIKAYGDVSFLVKNNLNGRRLIVARERSRREALRIAIQLFGLLVGVSALLTSNPPDVPSSVSVILLVVMQMLFVVNTILDKHDRNRLRDYWETARDRAEMVRDTAESRKGEKL